MISRHIPIAIAIYAGLAGLSLAVIANLRIDKLVANPLETTVMASFNRVILVGNVTRDVELRRTPHNTAVCDIGLAVNDRRKDSSGSWIDEVTYVDCTLFGRTAEVASEYTRKGSPVLIEGRLKLEQWEKDGKKQSKLKVLCDKLQMLSGGDRSSASPPADTETQPASRLVYDRPTADRQPAPTSGDDIPF